MRYMDREEMEHEQISSHAQLSTIPRRKRETLARKTCLHPPHKKCPGKNLTWLVECREAHHHASNGAMSGI